MKILFVIDNVEFKYFEFNRLVTSFWLIKEFICRGCELSITTKDRLYLDKNRPMAMTYGVEFKNDDLVMSEKFGYADLNTFQTVFFRPDPPVDINYINATYILDYVDPEKTLVLNRPSGIRSANEKIYINNFPSIVPDNIVTSDSSLIKDFLHRHGEIIIKPLNRCFSSGVFYLNTEDKNISTIIASSTNSGTTAVMVQKFIKAIEHGDKRLIFINGEIFPECVVKTHGEDDFKFNTHSDKFFKEGILSEKEKSIASVIAPRMLEDGLFIAGLDVIDGTVIEINVTSPCFFIKEINHFTGGYLEKKIVDKLEQLMLSYHGK
ncbi:MAG: hypothetical protein PHX18_04165 [Candidatus Gastranaerophilales bacterium]|nr:hypothetical protein [Candidatus Gastranaerophilales bacterium]